MEQEEASRPLARKTLPDRTIYLSRPMRATQGNPVLCDLGSARASPPCRGDIMPGVYRAPEVILGMPWSFEVDVWSVGVMVRAPFTISTGRCLYC